MSQCNLILVRHGQTDWNREGRVMGFNPIPLNTTGREQVARAAEFLKPLTVAAVYSSPIQRAMESAQLLAEEFSLSVTPFEAVKEINYGDWVNTTFAEIKKADADLYERYQREPSQMQVPGGEAPLHVQERAVAGMQQLIKRHATENVIVVSHADVIKVIVAHFLGLSIDSMMRIGCDNASVSVVSVGENQKVRVGLVNHMMTLDRIFRKV